MPSPGAPLHLSDLQRAILKNDGLEEQLADALLHIIETIRSKTEPGQPLPELPLKRKPFQLKWRTSDGHGIVVTVTAPKKE